MIKINNVTIPTPSEYNVGIQDLSKAERNARGTMIIERIATKRKLEMNWKYLTKLELQQLLNKTAPFNLKEDGFRGENTINAIAVFQKRQGLTVDGYAGAATFSTLRKLVNNPPKQVASDSPLNSVIANNKSNTEMLITTSATLKKSYEDFLQQAVNQKIIQPKWKQDYLGGSLSISDAIHLDILIRNNMK